MKARVEPLLIAAGFTHGLDLDLVDAISYALQELGHTIADVTAPADSELSSITNHAHFFDLVELRELETAHNRLLLRFDISESGSSKSYSQIADGLEKIITRKQAAIIKKYGHGSSGGMGATALERYVEDATSEYT